MSNYFEQQQINTVERVVLAEDISLPEISTEPLTLQYLETHNEYKLACNEYKDITAKFYINIMTPMVDKKSTYSVNSNSPIMRGHNNLETGKYKSTNYIKLTIPKYILLNFTKTIPKGTEFLIASVGGSIDLEDIRIIGIYEVK